MTGNIYYKGVSQGTWDYVIEKVILDYSDEKNAVNFLTYVFVIRS